MQVLERIPENDVITEYADGMAAAVHEYNRCHDLHHHQSIVLFVVQPNDRNSHDQQVFITCFPVFFYAQITLIVVFVPGLVYVYHLLLSTGFRACTCMSPILPHV